VRLSHLQNILQSLLGAEGEGIDLAEVLTPDAVIPLLSNPTVLENLRQYLPEEIRSESEVIALLRSPQFHSAVENFSLALQTGQLTHLTNQFNVSFNPVEGIEGFLRAIQAEAQKRKEEKKSDQMES